MTARGSWHARDEANFLTRHLSQRTREDLRVRQVRLVRCILYTPFAYKGIAIACKRTSLKKHLKNNLMALSAQPNLMKNLK